MIYLQVRLKPDSAPVYDVQPTTATQKLVLIATNILPMSLVVFMVIGFILLGIATPTEAAAFGVLGVIILATAFRALTWQSIRTSLESTLKVSGMVFFILMSSTVFSQLLAYSGASAGMLKWATSFEVSRLIVLLVMFIVLIVLGMFMDGVSMMLITVPIFFPLAHSLGFDLIWFGLFVLITLEMAGTTPPFGLLLYVMLGVAPRGTSLFQVANAAFPFLICDTILILVLVKFPEVALYLPGLMG
jgi:tripartite ATP-independent transporter DctM subunit